MDRPVSEAYSKTLPDLLLATIRNIVTPLDSLGPVQYDKLWLPVKYDDLEGWNLNPGIAVEFPVSLPALEFKLPPAT